MCKIFEKDVPGSRYYMIKFLRTHYRYSTMNSWNNATSYANCMKIYDLPLSSETKDKLYSMLQVDEAYEQISGLLDDFSINHGNKFQACWNGRSNGYLVLYTGSTEVLKYKSICRSCGQLNYEEVHGTDCLCGRCHKFSRHNLTKPIEKRITYSTGIDQDEDFENWTDDELRQLPRPVKGTG